MLSFESFESGLSYQDFLTRHGDEGHRQRWSGVHAQISLTDDQRRLLSGFKREMKVLVLAGAWCGDCVNQCPIFEHFAVEAPVITTRYLDRDAHPDVQAELQINGGNRVPVVVFFSEDGFEVSRFGERTLSKYRRMAEEQSGAACPTGLITPGDTLLKQVTQEWLDEFERVQWVLRLSPRLRRIHGD